MSDKITDEMAKALLAAGALRTIVSECDCEGCISAAKDALAAVYPLIEKQVREECAAEVAKVQPYYYTQTGYKDHPAGAFVLLTDVLAAIRALSTKQEIKPALTSTEMPAFEQGWWQASAGPRLGRMPEGAE